MFQGVSRNLNRISSENRPNCFILKSLLKAISPELQVARVDEKFPVFNKEVMDVKATAKRMGIRLMRKKNGRRVPKTEGQLLHNIRQKGGMNPLDWEIYETDDSNVWPILGSIKSLPGRPNSLLRVPMCTIYVAKIGGDGKECFKPLYLIDTGSTHGVTVPSDKTDGGRLVQHIDEKFHMFPKLIIVNNHVLPMDLIQNSSQMNYPQIIGIKALITMKALLTISGETVTLDKQSSSVYQVGGVGDIESEYPFSDHNLLTMSDMCFITDLFPTDYTDLVDPLFDNQYLKDTTTTSVWPIKGAYKTLREDVQPTWNKRYEEFIKSKRRVPTDNLIGGFSGRWFVSMPVTYTGTKWVHFIVDSGSGTTFINQDVVDALGIPHEKHSVKAKILINGVEHGLTDIAISNNSRDPRPHQQNILSVSQFARLASAEFLFDHRGISMKYDSGPGNLQITKRK